MRSKLIIPLVVLLVLPVAGCIEAAALALSALSSSPEASAMKQTGPMAESIGQEVIQQALGMIETGSTVLCEASRGNAPPPPPSERESEDEVPAKTLETPQAACVFRDVCLPGFDKPVTMRVCERPSADQTDPDQQLQSMTDGVGAWSWERKSGGNWAVD